MRSNERLDSIWYHVWTSPKANEDDGWDYKSSYWMDALFVQRQNQGYFDPFRIW